MSVVLYKDGERVLVSPQTLDSYINNGYFLTLKESLVEFEPELKEIPEDDDDVRKKAKELGISHWHVINIEKLKVKIEAKQNGDSEQS